MITYGAVLTFCLRAANNFPRCIPNKDNKDEFKLDYQLLEQIIKAINPPYPLSKTTLNLFDLVNALNEAIRSARINTSIDQTTFIAQVLYSLLELDALNEQRVKKIDSKPDRVERRGMATPKLPKAGIASPNTYPQKKDNNQRPTARELLNESLSNASRLKSSRLFTSVHSSKEGQRYYHAVWNVLNSSAPKQPSPNGLKDLTKNKK